MHASKQRRSLVMGLCCAPLVAAAQAPTAPEAGVDYVVLDRPQPPLEAGVNKIEVVDFFGYWCPHCFEFVNDLEAWRKRLPSDVAYMHVPVAFNPSENPLSMTFYALQSLGRLDDMHMKVFKAIHIDRKKLFDTNDIADFVAANGIDRDKWLSVYNSFSIASAVNRANQVWQNYRIDGTPTLACDGRFLTSPSIARKKGNAAALAVMDYLLERVRSERKKR
ncbi:MAG TPA: thiol:disulfide interchange protein DsbA/DsbL [Burkholderiaceae bacterium]|jgi:thiol:disulfide interchange protein DsbA|nr:thiol:disulfide interchange protein DsbA/DsbL [Burkholderiaceae bacterium]